MADYSQQVAELQVAAEICQQHKITTAVNGVQSEYPRWPEAWKACEIVWQAYLDMNTMALDGSDDDDRMTVIREARRLQP